MVKRNGLLERCVGPFDRYCSGAGWQPSEPYIAAPLIAFGVVPTMPSETLSRIVAFDQAEASFANITQTNMVQVSSFNGLNGLLLGYDLLPQPLCASRLAPGRSDVFCADPLFAVTRSLLGTITARRFPIAPGQHLLCAYKTRYAAGPCQLYGALAIALPEDRSQDADLFMEDHGILAAESDAETQKEAVAQALLDSIRLIGENLHIRYRRIFVSIQIRFVPEGTTGCALTAAPYLHLAKEAIPSGAIAALEHMPVTQWERDVADRYVRA